MTTNRLYVQFINDVDNMKNIKFVLACVNEIKYWIELNYI